MAAPEVNFSRSAQPSSSFLQTHDLTASARDQNPSLWNRVTAFWDRPLPPPHLILAIPWGVGKLFGIKSPLPARDPSVSELAKSSPESPARPFKMSCQMPIGLGVQWNSQGEWTAFFGREPFKAGLQFISSTGEVGIHRVDFSWMPAAAPAALGVNLSSTGESTLLLGLKLFGLGDLNVSKQISSPPGESPRTGAEVRYWSPFGPGFKWNSSQGLSFAFRLRTPVCSAQYN